MSELIALAVALLLIWVLMLAYLIGMERRLSDLEKR